MITAESGVEIRVGGCAISVHEQVLDAERAKYLPQSPKLASGFPSEDEVRWTGFGRECGYWPTDRKMKRAGRSDSVGGDQIREMARLGAHEEGVSSHVQGNAIMNGLFHPLKCTSCGRKGASGDDLSKRSLFVSPVGRTTRRWSRVLAGTFPRPETAKTHKPSTQRGLLEQPEAAHCAKRGRRCPLRCQERTSPESGAAHVVGYPPYPHVISAAIKIPTCLPNSPIAKFEIWGFQIPTTLV
ncbi:hypothetical protein B0J12DRAFT_69103 [Macrophomina phaseolina]|uniref:Uncharacterized protein n=1 Tax=Macrophomina phaseolina TaxID=35725 RepID=A0ABQ8GFS7_9PEZI|nr:hypothetical protein B0J12DRAFT_69103 [Macrophomina phaseolina]